MKRSTFIKRETKSPKFEKKIINRIEYGNLSQENMVLITYLSQRSVIVLFQ